MNDTKRDEQMRQWIGEAPEGELETYDAVVMWGVWVNIDDATPPHAMFSSEAEADGYAALLDRQEWTVAPVVLDLKTRNNFDIPDPM